MRMKSAAVEKNLTIELFNEVSSRLLRCGDGQVCYAAFEPLASELEPFAEPCEISIIRQNTFAELLYAFRNVLVHEFRKPGYGIDFDEEKTEPYSHVCEGKPRQLVFPTGFIRSLCEGCLAGLERYLTQNQKDPYTCYEFGSLWRESAKRG